MKTTANVFSPVRHRYSLAINRINASNPTILDLGGYYSRKGIIVDFIGECDYIPLNVGLAWYKNEKEPVIYDGKKIPFSDDFFDYVISVDSFEHIERQCRESLLCEMLRVAKKKVIIVVPFSHRDRETNEHFLLQICDKYNVEKVPSLVEHEKYGLPDLDTIKKIAEKYGGTVTYATEREEYWSIQMAMLWNSIVLGENSIEVNRLLQEFQELSLEQSQESITEKNAYRCVLEFVLEKENSK